MKAIRIHEFGGADVLRYEEVEKPALVAGAVLIKTEVAGVNYADTMLRNGTYLMRPLCRSLPDLRSQESSRRWAKASRA